MKRNKVKVCPFCGSGRIDMINMMGIYGFHCQGCGAVVSFIGAEDLDGATDAWNRRDVREPVKGKPEGVEL